jgi:osmotically inducible protein OsmC
MTPRTGRARWSGDLSTGSGTVTVGERAWTGNYSFASRFENGAGTNPEELIAAAHAGCFSMALVHMLTAAGHPARTVETAARVHLRMVDAMPTIDQIELETTVDAAGLDEAQLREIAAAAKTACAVSRALQGVQRIDLNATLAAPKKSERER